ncbi:MAG TPA: MgtC/SapB family protein [Chthoniobacterales bacterium]|nr:MgtC/SapB family protein [Chthoniobacterales bacterium]
MIWFVESWNVLLPKPWAPVLLAMIAILCGSWIGSERERREKPAGLRTMALVALGAAVFTMVGFCFTSSTGDSGRVAAQIVAGIGFLGAGVLVRGSGGVQGMTTAATIWIVAAIGMAVGAGYAPAGLGLSIVVRTLLTLVGRWELSHYGATRGTAITIDFEPDHGKTEIKLEQLLEEYMISRNAIQESNEVEGRVRWVIQFRLTERHRRELLLGLVDIPEVLSIERQ